MRPQRFYLFFHCLHVGFLPFSCRVLFVFQIFDLDRPACRLFKFQPAWSNHPFGRQHVEISSTWSGRAECGLSTNPIRPNPWTSLSIMLYVFYNNHLFLLFYYFKFQLPTPTTHSLSFYFILFFIFKTILFLFSTTQPLLSISKTLSPSQSSIARAHLELRPRPRALKP